MTIEELRESYYEEIKSRYLGLMACLDYNRAACNAEIAAAKEAIEKSAKTYYPDYDSEFFHRYYDDNGHDGDFYFECLDAYKAAQDAIGEFGGDWKIMKRHQAVRDDICQELRDLARQAEENFPRDFWLREPWEEGLWRWSLHSVRGVESP